MKTITFVTGNANKLKEVVAILSDQVGDFNIINKSVDLEEIQGTVEEVTIHKAKSASIIINGPVLVEDTCLGFDAMNNLPGPYIKWFVKAIGLTGLVDMLYKFENKGANAICTFGFCEPGKDPILFQGITHGTIVASRGPTNFGWDSVFQPDDYNQTYAEMDKALKNSISHRYKALSKVKAYLNS